MKKSLTRWKIITIILIGVFLLSATALLITNLVIRNQKEPQANTEAASSWNFATYDYDNERYFLRFKANTNNTQLVDDSINYFKNNIYGSYSKFEISSTIAFQAFGALVSAGVDFNYKTVEMNTDSNYKTLDFKGGYISVGTGGSYWSNINGYSDDSLKGFKGLFLGNGWIIKNFKMASEVTETQTYAYGSQVSNVYRYNISLFVLSGGEVHQLYIQDYTTSRTATNLHASLVYGNGKVFGCMIEGLSYSSLFHSGAFAAHTSWLQAVTDVEKSYLHSASTSNVSSFVFGGKATYCVSKIDNVFQDGYSSNCCSNSSSHSNLKEEVSSIGGKDVSPSTTFYYYKDFNNGIPYSRLFMYWTTVKIKVNDSKMGSVSNASISVPYDLDYNNNQDAYTSKNARKIVICGQESFVNVNTGYQFVEWKSRYGEHVAVLERIKFTITFKAASNTNQTANQTFTVYHGTTISVTPTSYSKSGTYSQVTYTFNAVDNGTEKSVSVTYTDNDSYCITAYTNPSSAITSNGRTFEVTCVKKTYGTTFQ